MKPFRRGNDLYKLPVTAAESLGFWGWALIIWLAVTVAVGIAGEAWAIYRLIIR